MWLSLPFLSAGRCAGLLGVGLLEPARHRNSSRWSRHAERTGVNNNSFVASIRFTGGFTTRGN